MNVRFVYPTRSRLFSVLLLAALLVTPSGLRAQGHLAALASSSVPLHSIKVIDIFNLFPNVGSLIYVAGPNDFGVPPGIVHTCSGTLIHERAFLVAGHCTAPTAEGLLPFITAFVTFSPNARDQSAWRPVSEFAFHPSLPPCPPPEGCTFRGLDPGILDMGLVFLDRPVRNITPARLARPGTLETPQAAGSPMIVPGYGFLDSVPGGPDGGMRPPMSEWDGWRRIKFSTLGQVVDDEWASWSVPGVVCYCDSGAPTFFNPDRFGDRSHDRLVAVASDGGGVCFTRDDRARVDTVAAQDWISRTIASVLSSRP
jgi:hypothetical protein